MFVEIINNIPLDSFAFAGWIPAAIAAAGVLGSVLGQQETNRSNQTIANTTNAFNQDEAQKDRNFQASQVSAQQEFQERMANTAHQREQADMKAAGLNPMLTAKGVGANSPSGGAASGAQASGVQAKMENPYASLNGIGTTAMDIVAQGASLKKQAAETDYIRTQNNVAKKNIPRAEITNEAYDWVKKKIKEISEYRAQTENKEKINVQGYDPKTGHFKFKKN